MEKKVIHAALLGFGTVGTGVYKVLKNQEEEMEAKLGSVVRIKKIMVRNLEKAAAKPVPSCKSFSLASAPGVRRIAAPILSKR